MSYRDVRIGSDRLGADLPACASDGLEVYVEACADEVSSKSLGLDVEWVSALLPRTVRGIKLQMYCRLAAVSLCTLGNNIAPRMVAPTKF
eukprot:3401798-Amphidinium_carterae.1